MSHQDVEVVSGWVAQIIPQSICSALSFRKDVRWSARQFVTVIWLWSLAPQNTLTELVIKVLLYCSDHEDKKQTQEFWHLAHADSRAEG
ncbi:hypothetical protein KOR42_55220 [Thalassoglobus neptunius]|uniref:Uncharacterized protein n=1 Tax=Thalassoglobus neptunius TaxID=1938619 RepID=A0A5C5UVE4_9PLAN|nr:hypothetical protein [Thalassoglobus neptunius]TWT29550.1 hypothetical protein KOR42_55220 [Thalassoglobus neptunius]